MNPLLSIADGANVLFPAEKTDPEQATIKVVPCLGCGGLPHGGVGAGAKCIADALVETRRLLQRAYDHIAQLLAEVHP